MAERGEIVRILEEAYAARQKGDMKRILGCFHEDGQFCAVGAESTAKGHGQLTPAMQQLIDAFELLEYNIHCMVIEGDKAAVHWRGKFRSNATGKTAETDLLDLIEVKDGRIASFHNFFDTAKAAQLMTP
jgi:ketosteroid isomerase-like protein